MVFSRTESWKKNGRRQKLSYYRSKCVLLVLKVGKDISMRKNICKDMTGLLDLRVCKFGEKDQRTSRLIKKFFKTVLRKIIEKKKKKSKVNSLIFLS